MKQHIDQLQLSNGPWFKQWFDSTYYHRLYANRDESEAAGFIDALLHHLDPTPGAAMLDVGCGRGRHCRQLAKNGFKATGLDIAFSSIREAKKYQSDSLHFYQHDMRRPFGASQFDYVFNFFTSFGYFNTLVENNAVVYNMAKALKPGGTLVIDYLNVAYSEKRLVHKEQKEIDGTIYNITRWSNDDYFFKRIDVTDHQWQQTFDYTEQVARFALEHFMSMFHQQGLVIKQVFGDYALNEYDEQTSPRLIMVVKQA
jgi:SAM-dependent methyltransferase